MTVTVTAPNESFTGRSDIGPVALDFDSGVAVAESLPAGVRAYLKAAGYKVATQRKSAKKEASNAD